MAKKINKKVAIIGIIVFSVIVLGIVGALGLQAWRHNPGRYIKRAESYRAEGDLKKAGQNYVAAFGKTKNKDKQIELLNTAAGIFEEINEWDSVVGCWNKISTIDTENWEAKLKVIGYLRERAESGEIALWPHLGTTVSELIEAQENVGVEIDPELYYLKGRALYTSASLGGTKDVKTTALEAIETLNKAVQLQGENADAETYWYLALCYMLEGRVDEDAGVLGASEKAKGKAEEILQACLGNLPDDPKANVNLLSMNAAGTREELLKLEPDYLELAKKFSDSVDVYVSLANYYNNLGIKDKALEAGQKAFDIESDDINYLILAARLTYDNYTIKGDEKLLDSAVELAEAGLTMPGAQDGPAKTQSANINRKFGLHRMLAQIYIEQALVEEDETVRDELISKAETNVHEIKQIIGAVESPIVYKWDGLLNLAKGNNTQGIRQMYTAYTKLKASGKDDTLLSYILAEAFMNTSESGAVSEFLNSAFKDRNFLFTRPNVLLQYVPIIIRGNPASALVALNTYETYFGEDSKSKILKIQANMTSGDIEKAEELIDELAKDDPNRVMLDVSMLAVKIRQQATMAAQLRASLEQSGTSSAEETLKGTEIQIEALRSKQVELLAGLIAKDAKLVNDSLFSSLMNYYLNEKQILKAQKTVKAYFEAYPESTTAGVYELMLEEEEPNDIPKERLTEITTKVVNEISEPVKRHAALAGLYQSSGEIDKAISEYQKVLEIEPDNGIAFDAIFEKAVIDNDIALLEKLVETAKEKNFDRCQGLFYSARLSIANKNYNDALEKIDKCLEERPIFSLGYYSRSKLNAQLGNFDKAIDDAHKAMRYNPHNREFPRNLALILYKRNASLGSEVSPEQVSEAKTAIRQAYIRNPADQNLQMLYADYIAESEPEKVLAMLQNMQKQSPTADTAIKIATIAMRIATRTGTPLNPEIRQAMYEIAESSLKQALQLQPDNEAALKLYSNMLQATGRFEEAEKIAHQDESVLWKFYLQNGRYEKAKAILERLYSEYPDIDEFISGLLIIAEKTNDAQGVEKYAAELVATDPENIEKQLYQIKSMLEVNLLDKAEKKLVAFREIHPEESRGLLLQALVDMRNSRLDAALKSANEALKFDPDSAQGWRLKGEINYLLANFGPAIDDLKRSKSINANPDIRIALAKAYIQDDQMPNAVTELKIAIQNPQAPMSGWLLLEKIHIRQDNNREIKKFYEKAITASQGSPFWMNKYAFYNFNNDKIEIAEKLFFEAWKKSQPNGNAASFNGYLQALIKAEKYDKAVSFASKYIDSDFSVAAFMNIAEAKFELGNKVDAIDFYNKAIDRTSENYGVIGNVVSSIYEVLGYNDTASMLGKKLSANPNSGPLNFAIFGVHLKEEKFDKAIGSIEKALSNAADEKEMNFLLQNKTNALQIAFQKTNKRDYFDRVLVEYEKIIAKWPKDFRSLNNAAYIMAKNGEQLDKALEYAGRVYKAIPNNPGIIDTYAYVLLKNGQYEEALPLLIKAKQIFEKQQGFAPADLHDHLGIVNKKLGNTEMALSSYKQAIETGRDELSDDDIERIERAIKNLEKD